MFKTFIIVFILLSSFSFSQANKFFCEEDVNGSYFPLHIPFKKVIWRDTYYLEKLLGSREVNGKVYVEFEQQNQNSETTLRFLREENGVVYEYEKCCNVETIRYDSKFKEGYAWKKEGNKTDFKIVSYAGFLETPYCTYNNLLVIEGVLSSKKFKFYYLKGYGFVGATEKDELIAYVTNDQ